MTAIRVKRLIFPTNQVNTPFTIPKGTKQIHIKVVTESANLRFGGTDPTSLETWGASDDYQFVDHEDPLILTDLNITQDMTVYMASSSVNLRATMMLVL